LQITVKWDVNNPKLIGLNHEMLLTRSESSTSWRIDNNRKVVITAELTAYDINVPMLGISTQTPNTSFNGYTRLPNRLTNV
jgi:hypothetical protein